MISTIYQLKYKSFKSPNGLHNFFSFSVFTEETNID